jgi:TP901 family phage tail tape measure protein
MVTNPAAADSGVQVAVSGDASGANSAIDGVIGKLGSLNAKALTVAAGGLAAVSAAAVAIGAKGVDSAKDFEEAMADVEKATSEQTADELADDIQDMSEEINLSTDELAQLASQAGRFGAEGSDNIARFTRVAAEMGAATTLSADEAGRSLAKVAEASGEPLDNIQQLGDSINELSNNFATNSAEIVDTTQRAGFALQELGLQSDEILGLSAAMNEVAPTSRRASTMLQQVTQAIRDPDNLEQFSELLGVSTEEFERMRDEEPQELLLSVAEAMEENEAASDDLTQQLSSAQTRAFQRLSGRSEALAGAMEMSNQAMEEGGSLAREVGIETDTLSGQMDLLRSEINNVFIGIGQELLPAVKDLVGGFSDFIDTAEEVYADVAPEVNEIIDDVTKRFGDFADETLNVEEMIGDVGEVFDDVGGGLRSAVEGNWSEAFGSLTDATETAMKTIRRTLVGEGGDGGLVSTAEDAVEKAHQWLKREGGDIIKEGIGALIDAGSTAVQELQTILVGEDGKSGVLSAMVDAGAEFLRDTAPELFGDAMEAIGTGIRQGLIDMTNPLRGEDSAFWDMLADAATWTINNLPDLFLAVGEGIIDAITEGVKGLFRGLVGNSVLKDEISRAGTWLQNNIGQVIGDVGGAIVDSIASGISGSVSAVTDAMGNVKDGVVSTVDDMKTSVTDTAGNMMDDVENAISGAKSKVKSAADTVGDTITGAFSDIKESVVSTTGDMMDGVASAIKSATNKVGNAADSVSDKITGAFQAASDKVWGNSIIPDMMRGIEQSIRSAQPRIVDAIDTIVSELNSRFQALKTAANRRFDDVISGAQTMAGDVQQSARTTQSHIERLQENAAAEFGQIESDAQSAVDEVKDSMAKIKEMQQKAGGPRSGDGGDGGDGSGGTSNPDHPRYGSMHRQVSQIFGTTRDQSRTIMSIEGGHEVETIQDQIRAETKESLRFSDPITASEQQVKELGDIIPDVHVQTGGLIQRGGAAVLHPGERVLPKAQVSDRGDASFDPDNVADGFDSSTVASELVQKLDRIDSAIRDDGTVRVSERDILRTLQRASDRYDIDV